jgi:hypothetical protein
VAQVSILRLGASVETQCEEKQALKALGASVETHCEEKTGLKALGASVGTHCEEKPGVKGETWATRRQSKLERTSPGGTAQPVARHGSAG